ncbi:MAG: hypothetical protein ACOY9Y_10410 [Bacillota bacterium]
MFIKRFLVTILVLALSICTINYAFAATAGRQREVVLSDWSPQWGWKTYTIVSDSIVEYSVSGSQLTTSNADSHMYSKYPYPPGGPDNGAGSVDYITLSQYGTSRSMSQIDMQNGLIRSRLVPGGTLTINARYKYVNWNWTVDNNNPVRVQTEVTFILDGWMIGYHYIQLPDYYI